MSRLPSFVGTKTMMLARGALFVGLLGVVTMLRGAEVPQEMPPPGNDSAALPAVRDEAFEALITSSPFTRSLGSFDSIILTGVARTGSDVFATLLNTESMESQVVSRTPNSQGWQLLGIGGNTAAMRTWSAKIQIPGGEVITVRYQEPPRKKTVRATSRGSSGGSASPLNSSQVQEAKQAAENYRAGFSSDGFPKEPPADVVQKLSRLSVGQREDINRQMLGLRNQGLGMDERRKIYLDSVDRASQGRR